MLRLVGAAILAFALCPCSALAESPSCAIPAKLEDGWSVVARQDAGFDPAALCGALDPAPLDQANIHSVLVERHGKLVAEIYREGSDRSIYSLFARRIAFDASTQHDMRSVSKSFVGLLAGSAIGDGAMSLSAPVLDYFPELADLRNPERNAIKVEHLLTMSSGLHWEETLATYGGLANDETHLYWAWNPDRFVLSRALDALPGTHFNYSGGNTAVLADIIERATKTSLRDYARTKIFEPMGIKDWEWIGDLWWRPIAFAGLRLRPRDLAKVGRMLLADGRWEGRQIVPAEWVHQSLAPHIAAGEGLSYGYHFWTGSLQRGESKLDWAAAFGNGGQRLFLVPELDLAIVMTAGRYNERVIGPIEMQIFRKILAALHE